MLKNEIANIKEGWRQLKITCHIYDKACTITIIAGVALASILVAVIYIQKVLLCQTIN